MRPAVVLNVAAVIVGAQATFPYCSDMTPDVDWCWNNLVYGRCTDNKLVMTGDCDYKSNNKLG
ncbi:hypothetical protein E8E14_014027 [Neopestalotiopsis sp. 37M]|nr:hypothetical protein E8E14_014027 [Neopestalotiopsis sp. 37M]